jgi:hypothetical protein
MALQVHQTWKNIVQRKQSQTDYYEPSKNKSQAYEIPKILHKD